MQKEFVSKKCISEQPRNQVYGNAFPQTFQSFDISVLETTFKTVLFRIYLHCNDIQEFDQRWDDVSLSTGEVPNDSFFESWDEMRRGESDQLSVGDERTRNKSKSFDVKRSEVGYQGEETCRSKDQDTNLRGQNKKN